MLRFLRIATLIAVLGFVLYWPVQFLLSQPQVAEAQEPEPVLPLPAELEDPTNSGLARTAYTPESYIPPQYDPFYNKYRSDQDFEEKIEPTERGNNIPPVVDFTIRTKELGLADANSGTIKTTFLFHANTQDHETPTSRMRVRWDFESDGTWDSFFSRLKRVEHVYTEPGTYTVTLEVLDEGGLLSRVAKQVIVVTNTAPFAHFTYKPLTGTESRIFTFETDESDDSQYRASYLQYRFDWDGDGKWDTPYERKTIWRHRFGVSGTQHVILEVVDPEGATARADAFIEVTRNTPPSAAFTVEVQEIKTGSVTVTDGGAVRKRYIFDASGSSDAETPSITTPNARGAGTVARLQYRWDFNYTGSDDIQFDTQFSTSPRHTGFYELPGERVVRLEVRDEDGAIDQAFATVFVE